MNSSKISCLLFTLSMILICDSLMPASASASTSAPAPASGESLYESVCKETEDPACLPLLKGDPRIPLAKNYFDISKFILEFAIEKAKEGQNYMREIAKKNPTEFLNACANTYYTSTISSFISARGELTEDTMTANYDAKVAGDGPQYCVEALAELKIDNPPINKIVALLSMSAFLATNHLD